jgi:hypothetical protein
MERAPDERTDASVLVVAMPTAQQAHARAAEVKKARPFIEFTPKKQQTFSTKTMKFVVHAWDMKWRSRAP